MAENAGSLLGMIVPNIRKTANLVQEISIASEQQDLGLRQIKEGVEQLNEITQQNAAASEELASTAEMLSSHATSLQDMVDTFYRSRETSEAPAAQVKEVNVSGRITSAAAAA